LLSVREIDFQYSQIQVLYGISFEVRAGEFVALIGANGAGKTTTMKAISGLVHPRRGEIRFMDRPVHRKDPHEITALGLIQIPEGRKIFSSLTVRENLEMGSYIATAKKKRRETMEKVFGLFPVLKTRHKQVAGTLSGGEQQMLAIGRALMSLPSLLMIDEPSLGLAPIITETIFKTIKDVNDEGKGTTILLVEQNVFASLQMAHRGYVLENGRIVLQGASEELLGNEQIKKAYLGL
jgi:branched-chain amino acid transport system ATP-binding protein